MSSALTEIGRIDIDIESYLQSQGEVFRAFREQDSGCVSYGVLAGGRRWLVKHSHDPQGIASLESARRLYAAMQHPALPRLHNAFETPGGLALVLDWLPGEVLYDYTARRGTTGRDAPDSPHARFRALPVDRILAALDTVYDAHMFLAERGFIAVDLYDGSIIYDFDAGRTYLCDLDEYRPGPFVLDADRLPGSRRFMAPEEWQRGATIDQATNVFTLGRIALELLGDGTGAPEAWRGSAAMLAVAVRATAPERDSRYPDVRAFVAAWRAACSNLPCAS